MMKILIDNKDIESIYGIKVLDYSDLLGFAEIRQDELQWFDKSGVDPNLSNIRYESREFTLKCLVKQDNIILAKNKVKTLLDYIFQKGVVVISIRDIENGIREAFLCERSSNIVPTINIREQNSIYVFTIGFKDINPNAIKYYNQIVDSETSINYTKGTIANIYWGNGDRSEVNNSGTYLKDDYSADDYIDIIIDADYQSETVSSLSVDFSADTLSGVKPQIVNFTDASIGTISLWSWDFGDGSTSSLQNPSHTYQSSGTFTVKLQVFNSVGGYASLTKTNYITVRPSWLMINETDVLLINSTDKFLIN